MCIVIIWPLPFQTSTRPGKSREWMTRTMPTMNHHTTASCSNFNMLCLSRELNVIIVHTDTCSIHVAQGFAVLWPQLQQCTSIFKDLHSFIYLHHSTQEDAGNQVHEQVQFSSSQMRELDSLAYSTTRAPMFLPSVARQLLWCSSDTQWIHDAATAASNGSCSGGISSSSNDAFMILTWEAKGSIFERPSCSHHSW